MTREEPTVAPSVRHYPGSRRVKIYPPLWLSVRSLIFLESANLIRPSGTVDKARLREMLVSGESRMYRNFGIMGENELRRWLGMPDRTGKKLCPNCGKVVVRLRKELADKEHECERLRSELEKARKMVDVCVGGTRSAVVSL